MRSTGRKTSLICFAMLGALLFSGCDAAAQQSQLPAEARLMLESLETAEEEEPVLEAHETLRNQLISTLNLNRTSEQRITSSWSLDTSADFLMDIVLQNPLDYYVGEGKYALTQFLGDPMDEATCNSVSSYAFIYDGSFSSTQMATIALELLSHSYFTEHLSEVDQCISNLSVVHGGSGELSAWLILVQTTDPEAAS